MDGCQRGLASAVYKFLIKNIVEVVLLKNQIISWQMSFINHSFDSFSKYAWVVLLKDKTS